jgi:hypothetical protein
MSNILSRSVWRDEVGCSDAVNLGLAQFPNPSGLISIVQVALFEENPL